MKRFYTIAMAIAAVLSAQALTPMQGKVKPRAVNPVEKIQPTSQRTLGAKSTGKAASLLKAKSRDAEDSMDIIIDPEGTHMAASVNGTHFLLQWGYLDYINEDTPGEVVWGDDGTTVYIRDIVSCLKSGVYVKGELADGKVTVKLPQVCYVEADEDTGEVFAFYANKMEYQEEGAEDENYYNVAAEDDYVVYSVGEDGTLTMELNDGDPQDLDELPQYVIGVCKDTTPGDCTWYYFGESYQTISKFDQEPVTAPADVDFETWALISVTENCTVEVGFSGDNVYIRNFAPDIADMTIKGTVQGDKVVFECRQYMGQAYGAFIYLMACQWTDDTWEECEMLDAFEMLYDAETKVMWVDNPLIDILINASLDDYYPLYYYECPTFMYQSEEDVNAAPEDPFVVYFDEYAYRSYYGISEGYIEWDVPSVNVKGFLLNTDDMYYIFYINGEKHTFEADDCRFIEEDITEIPYDFTDGYDIQALGESRYLTYRDPDARTFGLQSFFLGSDGVLYASNLVTYEPELSGISTVKASPVKSVEFYNMQGQQVSNPSNGVYIMRNVYEDGSTSVCKISKK